MARRSLKQWLVAANGWQRIWFVGTIVCFFYFILIYPLTETNKGNSYRYNTKWAIEKEMKNPECTVYMSGTFSQLKEPEFDPDGRTGCYNIYLHRKYLEENKPITMSSYNESFVSEAREQWAAYIGMGAFISLLLSVFVYAVGAVVSWIVRGFKKSDKQ
jgi:hypothetical protein